MATIWYLWATNDNPPTNEYLVKVIGESNGEELFSEKRCADGTKRNLFRCPKGYANVQSAIAAHQEFNLKFEVFKKEDTEDAIIRYVLWKNSARNAAKAMRMNAVLKKNRGHAARFKSV
ncbi:MAG: hypothetical protein ACHQU0_02120 [Candidatus Paceibacteria bacterium]